MFYKNDTDKIFRENSIIPMILKEELDYIIETHYSISRKNLTKHSVKYIDLNDLIKVENPPKKKIKTLFNKLSIK